MSMIRKFIAALALGAAATFGLGFAGASDAQASGKCFVHGAPHKEVKVFAEGKPGAPVIGSLYGGTEVTLVGRIHYGHQIYVRLGWPQFAGQYGFLPQSHIRCTH
jgi:hypothetical protein